MENVLITGGTGLVGTRLTELLLDKGYGVMHVSRRKNKNAVVPTYKWKVSDGWLHSEAIEKADYIIHLAGANVADSRWTKSRKKVIVDSRVLTSNLLYDRLKNNGQHVKAFISASAIGYYGNRGDEVLEETAKPSNCFLGKTTQLWEKASQQVATLGIRTALLRIGLVLSKEGGALPKTALPLKFGLGTIFGNGQQYYSWIHIDDVCRLFIHAMENEEINGAYNAVAPKPSTNKELVEGIAKVWNKKPLTLSAPERLLRLAMGQMADIVLFSANVSAEKTLQSGFVFNYPNLQTALEDIYV